MAIESASFVAPEQAGSNPIDIVFKAGEIAAAAFDTRDASQSIRAEDDDTQAFTCGATNNTCVSCRETDCVTCRCTAGVTCGCGE